MNLDNYQKHCYQLLENALPADDDICQKAMRYSVLAGGKRLRPILVYLTGEIFHADQFALDNAAIAVELIHAYSLIHDDLPALDDAPLRHGKPSTHKTFGESIAILAGDGLQSLAFDVLSRNEDIQQIKILVKATNAMVIGQSMDMQAENKQIDLSQLQRIHALKTGALILASVQLGARCSGVDDNLFENFTHFAEKLGLAYQIKDDILDVVANSKKLGKMAGSDAKQHKSTYVSLLGVDKANRALEAAKEEALNFLHQIPQANKLEALLHFTVERDY